MLAHLKRDEGAKTKRKLRDKSQEQEGKRNKMNIEQGLEGNAFSRTGKDKEATVVNKTIR